MNGPHIKSKSSLNRKVKTPASSVYSSKLPKIKRFINIYQANGLKNTKKTLNVSKQKVNNDKREPKTGSVFDKQEEAIVVQDSIPGNIEHIEERSLDSSLEVIAASCELNNQSQNNALTNELKQLSKNSQH